MLENASVPPPSTLVSPHIKAGVPPASRLVPPASRLVCKDESVLK